MEVVNNRWNGDPTSGKIGLHAPQHLLAMLVDPGLCPPEGTDHLPEDWQQSCDYVLGRFHKTDDFTLARSELQQLIIHAGSFKHEEKVFKESIEVHTSVSPGAQRGARLH